MRLLLDTHVLVWALGERKRLKADVLAQLADGSNSVFFSAISIWEIAIKFGLGKPDFKLSPTAIAEAAISTGFQALPVKAEHALAFLDLPALHGDRFDRMLVAQARNESMLLLTRDALLGEYGNMVRTI